MGLLRQDQGMIVRAERNGWRDEWISNRHRAWGVNCPAVDLEFIMCEYNHGMPVALVEYKHVNAKPVDRKHATYRALIALADGYRHRPLPAFVALYNSQEATFKVQPLNQHAETYFGSLANTLMSEQEFVRHLYLLRKKVLTAEDEAVIRSLSASRGLALMESGDTLNA
jgi:hypothetical protein